MFFLYLFLIPNNVFIIGSHWGGGSYSTALLFEGAWGGTPPLFQNLFLAKSCLIGISEKSKGFGTFRTTDKGTLRDFPKKKKPLLRTIKAQEGQDC